MGPSLLILMSFSLLVRSDGTEADCMAMCGKSTCEPKSQDECKTLAAELGLGLGGNGYSFADTSYGTDGCYTYTSGTYSAYAYYGLGGTDFKSVKSGQKRLAGRSICKTPVCECESACKSDGSCKVGLRSGCPDKKWEFWELSYTAKTPCITTRAPTAAPFDRSTYDFNSNYWVDDDTAPLFLGIGCLKSSNGPWKEVFKTSATAMPGFDMHGCFHACNNRPPGECKIFAIDDGRCFVSETYDFSPEGFMTCQEEIYLPPPGFALHSYLGGTPKKGDVNCTPSKGRAGLDGDQTKMGVTSTMQECAEKVNRELAGANAAQWHIKSKKCTGIVGMKKVRPESYTYKTCYIFEAKGRSGEGLLPLGERCSYSWQCRGKYVCEGSWLDPTTCKERGWWDTEKATTVREAIANAQTPSQPPSNLWVNGFALIGLATLFYGASNFYCKGQ